MRGDPGLDFESLLQQVAPGATLLSVEPMQGGFSSRMTFLRAERDGQEIAPLVVRQPSPWALGIDANAARNEFGILRAVHSAGLPVAEPLLLTEGEAQVLVLSYVEGGTDFRPGSAERTTAPMGDLLARIHAIEPASAGLDALPRLAAQVEEKLVGWRGAPGNEDRLLAAIAARWPFPAPEREVLLHGDFWPGNLLWRDGELVGVIDWEDSAVGDQISDLAIARLDTLMIFGRDAMEDLTLSYAAAADADLASLPLWDLWAAVRMQSYLAWTATFDADWVAAGRPDITEKSANDCIDWFASEALGTIAAR